MNYFNKMSLFQRINISNKYFIHYILKIIDLFISQEHLMDDQRFSRSTIINEFHIFLIVANVNQGELRNYIFVLFKKERGGKGVAVATVV